MLFAKKDPVELIRAFWYIFFMGVPFLKTLFSVLLLASVLTACASVNKNIPSGVVQTGIASWYGKDFHGRPTASGEIYNMYAMTAAHKELPLGTVVDVTNLGNRRHVSVVINDRGPFVRDRVIDLSYSAAKDLDMVSEGTARVSLKVMGRDRKYVRDVRIEDSGHGDYYAVQLGAFLDRQNAERLKTALDWKHSGAYILRAEVAGKTFYRVRIGRSKTRDTSYKLAQALAEEGYPAIVMRD